LTPAISYSECGGKNETSSDFQYNLSDFSSNELYQMYIENVEMNNPYMHQMNHLGYKHNSTVSSNYIMEFNLTALELLEKAQEESYKLFKEWIKDADCREEFISKMNEYNSNKSNYFANKELK
jgi:hypothetical protein